MTAPRYGIAEWYGQPLIDLTPAERSRLAEAALDPNVKRLCPFRNMDCNKAHGVCSIDRYEEEEDADGEGTGRIGRAYGAPVIVCPNRFEEDQLLIHWLAEIVGFAPEEVQVAREVPFMRNPRTGRAAGMIDLVVAKRPNGDIEWYGMEIQAVYFSGTGMESEIEAQRAEEGDERPPPFPDAVRRPDWRSSSAKRLMPQLEIKIPLLRRWRTKTAIVLDRTFFETLGGPSPDPSQDLDAGDVIWMITDLIRDNDGRYRLTQWHWEVLTLESTRAKLRSAADVPRAEFERTLRSKLEPLDG